MILERLVQSVYRNELYKRKDNPLGIFHFGPQDFPGLKTQSYIFSSKQGQVLTGYFYYYENPIADRLLVFDHGMGNGHRAYMREIEILAKAGFLVFSYDHTGCMESGGEGTNGLAQSLSDLDDCLNALRYHNLSADRSVSVIGHSWGGFSTMNICALHPEITHIVSMCGFLSVEQMINQIFRGFLKGYRNSMLQLERSTNPNYAGFHAADSLENTDAKVLLIYCDNDPTVKKRFHYTVLRKALAGKDNIQFLLLHGKEHNPTYTLDAVKYKKEFFTKLQQQQKKDPLRTNQQKQDFMSQFDWYRMTAQDETVWTAILDALKAE